MSITIEFTSISKLNIAKERTNYLLENITLELLNPLYPTLIQTQTDVHAVIKDLIDQANSQWLLEHIPGLIGATSEPYSNELGSGNLNTRIFQDIESYNYYASLCPVEQNCDLYHIEGTNLIRNSDGTIADALTPKEYARWKWVIDSQIINTTLSLVGL